MEIRKRYILIGMILLGFAWYLQNKTISRANNQQYSSSIQQLRNVGRLAIIEQSFLLQEPNKDGKHAYLADLVIAGKIGLEINLADSIHSDIEFSRDTMLINIPLKISYVNLDDLTLQQIADVATTANVDKTEITKQLDKVALEEYLPPLVTNLKKRPLSEQEERLSRLINMPVKIIITRMPEVKDWP